MQNKEESKARREEFGKMYWSKSKILLEPLKVTIRRIGNLKFTKVGESSATGQTTSVQKPKISI